MTTPQTEKSTKATKIAEALNKSEVVKKKREEKLKKEEEAKKAKLKKEGLDLFFAGKDNWIPASPDEYEGKYPGNQNNAVLIPYADKQVYDL